MARPSLVLTALALAVGGATHAFAAPPVETPGSRAILAGEDPALGTSMLDLGEAPASSLWGKPIRRIDVVTVGDRWTSPVVTGVRAGDAASPEAARRLLRDVLAQGRFARANVEAFAEDGGVVLRLNVLPRRLIAAIKTQGGALDDAETLDAAGIAVGGELTSLMFDGLSTRIRRFYDLHGFPAAEVRVAAGETDQEGQVVVAVDVSPGEPRTVKQRVFVIDAVADQELRKDGDLKQAYRVGPGARVDEPALADADRDLTESLRQHGFSRADVRHALRHVDAGSYLYVYVTPGPRLVPSFEGNRAFDASDLEGALNLEKAPDDRPAELVDRLRAFYVARGFLDVEASMTEKGKPGDPVRYLAFTLREHRQVRVTETVFPCFTPADDLSLAKVKSDIGSFLEEDLPGADTFSPPDPRIIDRTFGPIGRTGGRGAPADLRPLQTYAPDTYDRALKHLRDLFRSKGYMNAVVGPITVVRAACARRSPDDTCVPVLPKEPLQARCLKDSLGLPIAEPRPPESFTCRPDPSHDVVCSPELTVRIPIALGPQTGLYDLAFEGNRSQSSAALAKIADLPLGTPLSSVELEAARIRVLDAYRRRGYAYAEVRTSVEPSPDRTRARVRFFVTEREPVIVTGFVVKGATRTSEPLVLRRVALRLNAPFQQDWARQTEERIATLGTFSSVTVGLEDADVPERRKRVVITVVESPSQYLETRPGFSTGDGVRLAFEWGHRNLGGLAISVALRAQLGYLFDFLILDPNVKEYYAALSPDKRLEQHHTVSFNFPEVGLGPLVSFALDTMMVRHNAHDYGIWKVGAAPTFTYRPLRQITTQLGVTTEYNNVTIFNADAQNKTINLLRAPQGETVAVAQRLGFTASVTDKPLSPAKGVVFTTAVEHVNAFPVGTTDATTTSHFLSFTGRIAGYVPFGASGVRLALVLGAGYNLQLTSSSKTYPDRLFFLGGVDSLRAFLADSVVPEDVAECIVQASTKDCQKFPKTVDAVAMRGGDLSLNPRAELIVPLKGIFQAAAFLDAGNLWVEPSRINAELRYAAGAALLVDTPIGPLAFSYGFNLNRRPWEDLGAFHFKIGVF